MKTLQYVDNNIHIDSSISGKIIIHMKEEFYD